MHAQEQYTVDAAIAILNKYLRKSPAITSNPEAVRQYLRLNLEREDREVFYALFLNAQLGVISAHPMFYGSLRRAPVCREIARKALLLNAAAVVVAHNHLSGDGTPSEADKRLTTQLKNTLDLVGIRLLDHFVVGAGNMTSFSEAGLL
ncbi:MAG: JAB domain-containing protein [Pigmentiphaga sp.]|uniref:JAB domain-containing protein n=1 Tax=Pigmentiphaga sp. TaxID=1977564 RepID=UPI0029AD00D9|nr:JAB domain-containing protein [Pigmentiphaga sp.]MDX3904427.1 JAB domain-containing protein [Pigmentiphaga sp.]